MKTDASDRASAIFLALSQVPPDQRAHRLAEACGTDDDLRSVVIWDIEQGRKVDELKGHTALVGSLDFSPDGDLLATSSRDGSTRLWDVDTGQWLAVVAARRPGAERVGFLDGRRLAIGYQDGEVEIRDLTYFFRYAAGHAEYQLRLFRNAGESFPRADDVLAWSRAR